MQREARVNLIFLIALLALSTPGLVLLVGKALNGTGGLNASPPSSRVATPYLNPVGTAPDTVRLAPPKTVAFVDDVAREHTGRPATRPGAAGGRPSPVIGEKRQIELLGRDGEDWVLAIWHHRDGPDVDAVTATADNVDVAATVDGFADVPGEVREELQDGPPLPNLKGYAGYAAPPRRLSVVRVTAPASAGRLSLSWRRGDLSQADEIDLSALPHDDDADIPGPAAP